ncbi:hypothetical protein CsatB_022105 [Cannabis sativa]|uniref:At4g15545-like C-terminal domain-containing protein n=1 Tax=Cannabis sativa TaxID=3483 RepID=A0A7J6HJL6_CANSA|nr:hypothetical protein F8388_015201 [Cannabis sativa]KAF4395443.1 hypothetical protein G4B88_010907 [Cannabis sativa]
MLAKESTVGFDLPEEVLQLLPSDPFEQLDVARKITSIALSTRVSSLESESSDLRAKLADKDDVIADLQSQIQSLDASLSQTTDKLAVAEHEKENLVKENAILSNLVKKLNKDVSKLEVFRKTLMRSLQEDDDSSGGAPDIVAKIKNHPSLSSSSQIGEDDASGISRTSSMRSQFSEVGNSVSEDRDTEVTMATSRPRVSPGLLLASQTSTPRLTPPGSPPIVSASVSPTKTSKPVSPRRHAISFSTSRGMFEDRFGSATSGHYGADPASHTARTRVDGKEFFRQVRSRLSYEQFGAFLSNVKELNSHKQTKEEALQKVDEIFGPDNKDLYAIFEGLISRNINSNAPPPPQQPQLVT